MRRFLAAFMVICSLVASSCGSKKITCNNEEGINLLKKLMARQVAIEYLDHAYRYMFWMKGNPSWEDIVDQYQICKKKSTEQCKKYVHDYNVLYNNMLKDGKYKEVFKMKRIFTDDYDKKSNSVVCHADVEIKAKGQPEPDIMNDVAYKFQLSQNKDYVEVWLLTK